MSASSSAVVAPPRPRASGWARLPLWVRRGLLFVALIALWQAYVSLRHVNPLLFSSPWTTAKAFGSGWADGSLAGPTWTTLRILLEGVAIGAVIAVLFTVFATLTKVGDDLLTLLTSILNPLPGVAVLPLAMLWFGLNTNAILFAIANATIWPIAINLSTGFKTANQTIVAVGRNIGLSNRRIVTDVLAPGALPFAISGLKAAWAFGWRTIIAAELVFGVAGSKGGLGNYINNARNFLYTNQMFAGLATIALLGIVFEALFGVLERRTIVRWGMKTT